MSTWCRYVHVRPHRFILTEACSCRLGLTYFAGKISHNRLVCKNAFVLAYYGSCRFLVMGSLLGRSAKISARKNKKSAERGSAFLFFSQVVFCATSKLTERLEEASLLRTIVCPCMLLRRIPWTKDINEFGSIRWRDIKFDDIRLTKCNRHLILKMEKCSQEM